MVIVLLYSDNDWSWTGGASTQGGESRGGKICLLRVPSSSHSQLGGKIVDFDRSPRCCSPVGYVETENRSPQP